MQYQWKAFVQKDLSWAGDIGNDSETYTLTEAELGKYIYVAVTSSGNSGSVWVWTDTVVSAPIAEFDLAAAIDAAVAAQETAGGTNAAATPATVVLLSSINISDKWREIDSIIKTQTKYVTLDLSACSATDNTITGNSNVAEAITGTGNDMNLISTNTYLKGIIFPDSLTSIGTYSFKDCTNITSVTIPAGVTGIAAGAFSGCGNLVKVVFMGSSTVIADTTSFYRCSYLLTAGSATAGSDPMAAGTYTRASHSSSSWTKTE